MKSKFTEQNGITLIALIITIIVMLILVAVTISVALNGGIFNKAKDASDKTNLAKEEEILQTTALGYLQKNSGYVDLSTFATEKDGLEGYDLTYVAAKDYVTAIKGGQTFYITKQGGITKTEPQTGEEENNSGIIGKWYYWWGIGNDDDSINITSSTITGEPFDDYTDVAYTLNENILTITYYDEDEECEDTYYIDEDGLIFVYNTNKDKIGELSYVKSDAKNVDHSLLNGIHFTMSSTWTISNDGILTLSDDSHSGWTYTCHNGKAYLYDSVFTINYNELDEPISLTDSDDDTYTLESN